MNGYIELSYWDLAIASLFLLINGGVSLAFKLGIERTLLLNGVRMVEGNTARSFQPEQADPAMDRVFGAQG